MALAESLRRPATYRVNEMLSRKVYSLVDDVKFGLTQAQSSVFKDAETIDNARAQARKRSKLSGVITTVFTLNTDR